MDDVTNIYDMQFLHNNTIPDEIFYPMNDTSLLGIDNHKTFHYVVTWIRNIFVPTNVAIGLTGNFLALAVFTASHQRHLSSSGYLAALACADNLFLISLFITWFDGIYPIRLTTEACRFIIFTTYISSFLSVWYVVCFTCERYIAICHPLRAPMILGKLSEKVVVIILAVLACTVYSVALWTTHTSEYKGHIFCVPDQSYFHLITILTWFDTVITMLLPFVLILLMNLRIVWCVFVYQSKRRNILQTHSTAVKNTSQMRITRTLLLVSTTFLVLNLPSHVVRMEQMLGTNTESMPLYKRLIQELTQYIYYATFSVNFFLYAIYGKHFKRSLTIMLNNICRRKKSSGRCPEWSRSDYNRTSMTSMHVIQRAANGSIYKHASDV